MLLPILLPVEVCGEEIRELEQTNEVRAVKAHLAGRPVDIPVEHNARYCSERVLPRISDAENRSVRSEAAVGAHKVVHIPPHLIPDDARHSGDSGDGEVRADLIKLAVRRGESVEKRFHYAAPAVVLLDIRPEIFKIALRLELPYRHIRGREHIRHVARKQLGRKLLQSLSVGVLARAYVLGVIHDLDAILLIRAVKVHYLAADVTVKPHAGVGQVGLNRELLGADLVDPVHAGGLTISAVLISECEKRAILDWDKILEIVRVDVAVYEVKQQGRFAGGEINAHIVHAHGVIEIVVSAAGEYLIIAVKGAGLRLRELFIRSVYLR